MSSDYENELAENAAIVTDRLDRTGNGKAYSVYNGRAASRPTKIAADNTILVRVGQTWKSAYVDPSALRDLIVRNF